MNCNNECALLLSFFFLVNCFDNLFKPIEISFLSNVYLDDKLDTSFFCNRLVYIYTQFDPHFFVNKSLCLENSVEKKIILDLSLQIPKCESGMVPCYLMLRLAM